MIDADALKSKIREQSWKQETKVSLMLDWIYMLIDEASTVSTVQNKALQQENEQLQAQVARMREALIECVNALELCTHDELCKIAVSPYDMIQDAKEALAEIDKAIGGKEDV